jgi:hypothetical protein
VARAKRTARAEARRRYRATQNPEYDDDFTDGSNTADPAAPRPTTSRSTPSSASSRPPTPAPGTRMPFTAAIRAATRPVHVREDLAALPWIAVHSKALWLPVLITLIAFGAIIATNGSDLSLLFFQYFIATPAIGGVFLAGFLAPRASWLLGAIVGFVAAICYSILVIAFPSTLFQAATPTFEQARDVALVALVMSPLFGALLASGAAWYRRFLRLTAPVRAPSNERRPRAGDGRTRSAGVQKAGAKR